MKSDRIILIGIGIFLVIVVILCILCFLGVFPFNSLYKNPMTGNWITDPNDGNTTIDPENVCGPYCRESSYDQEVKEIYEGL